MLSSGHWIGAIWSLPVKCFSTGSLIADGVPIGRASTSPSKGFLGAMDNAWFDSPVMSRDHAEIFVPSPRASMTETGSFLFQDAFELIPHTPVSIA
jgi:hypothetical protein